MRVFPERGYSSWISLEDADLILAEAPHAEEWFALDPGSRFRMLSLSFHLLSALPWRDDVPLARLQLCQCWQALLAVTDHCVHSDPRDGSGACPAMRGKALAQGVLVLAGPYLEKAVFSTRNGAAPGQEGGNA